jgi:hypothetical protein
MTKARKTPEDLLRLISHQTKRSIRSAGPRYTPNVAVGAPNLVVETISAALAALSGSRKWKSERVKQAEHAASAFRGLVNLSVGPEVGEIETAERFTDLLRGSTTLTPLNAGRVLAALFARTTMSADLTMSNSSSAQRKAAA